MSISIPTIFLWHLYRLVQALKVESLQEKQAMSNFPQVWFHSVQQAHRLTTYYLHDQKFIYIAPKHGSRPWVSICFLLLLSLSLTMTMTFPHLCCVQWLKKSSGLAVSPDKCLELICKSCSKLWSPYGFRILRFGKNSTLVSMSATGKPKKAKSFL